MNPILILTFTLVAIGASVYFLSQSIPFNEYANRMRSLQEKQVQKLSSDLEDMFYKPSSKLISLFIFSPIILVGLTYILTRNILFTGIAGIIAFIIPSVFLLIIRNQRVEKINIQLIDALIEIANSLKGGLSIVQALEEVAQNSPSPLKDELLLALRSHKVGVPLEESLQLINQRVKSEYLQLTTQAIIIGKETGGNLIRVFGKLIVTIRERRKLEEKMKMLTFQSRLQAIIISGLPVVFFIVVNKTDPHHFDIMKQTELGRMLLWVCGGLLFAAWWLIIKIATLKY